MKETENVSLIEPKNVEADIVKLKKMLSAFKQKEESLQHIMRLETPHYNIFEVLKIRHYEARVHTPFLAHLLDPKGNHQQGPLFFNRFFKEVLKIDDSPADFKNISIRTERRNKFGQIDLEIWYQYNGIRKAVVIENKIYHHDGEEQLFRYYQYLKAKNIGDCDLRIVYLTLDGKSPSSQSKQSIPDVCLQNVSYRTAITAWLTICLEDCNPNPVFYTIKQYLKTINNL